MWVVVYISHEFKMQLCMHICKIVLVKDIGYSKLGVWKCHGWIYDRKSFVKPYSAAKLVALKNPIFDWFQAGAWKSDFRYTLSFINIYAQF